MKISRDFKQRLQMRKPDSTIEVLVLIAAPFPSARPLRRGASDYASPIAATLDEIDEVLTRFGGRRLADHVDALGSLPVETTPEGVRALAELSKVRAILESQAVLPLH